MKYFTSLFALILVLSFSNISAQLKIGYVDSQTIMDQLPDAKDAQKKLDSQIEEWQKELTEMQAEWKEQYDDYERRKLIMGKQKKAEVEKDLIALEEKAENFKQSKFGASGELYKMQEELMKPIQNQVFYCY